MKDKTSTIYFRMPRVASHSLMRLVSHRVAILPHSLSPESVRHFLLVNEMLFRWTFVRDPLTRFVSAYRWAQREYLADEYPLDAYEMKSVRGVPIKRVAENLSRLCAGPAIHFHPQSWFISDGDRLLVDWFGRFEVLSEDFGKIARILKIDRAVEFGANVKSASGPVGCDELTDGVRAIVSDFYAEDFERFGYPVERHAQAHVAKEVKCT